MKRVIIESPYKGRIERNMRYLHEAVHDCLKRGESPYASHAFFTQFLDDSNVEERYLGITAGLVWSEVADLVAVYTDFGISSGMEYAIEAHNLEGREIEYRRLYDF